MNSFPYFSFLNFSFSSYSCFSERTAYVILCLPILFFVCDIVSWKMHGLVLIWLSLMVSVDGLRIYFSMKCPNKKKLLFSYHEGNYYERILCLFTVHRNGESVIRYFFYIFLQLRKSTVKCFYSMALMK